MIIRDLLHKEVALLGRNESYLCHVGYAFCRKTDARKRSSLSVIKTLLWQVIALRSRLNFSQQDIIIENWRSTSTPEFREADSSTASQSNTQMLLGVLSQALRSFRRTFLVIDGIDECDDPAQVIADLEMLVNKVEGDQFGASHVASLHILCVSQALGALKVAFGRKVAAIEMDSQECIKRSDQDIRLVVTSILQMSDIPAISKNMKVLRDSIVEKASSMMLWATLATRHLVKEARYAIDEDSSQLSKVLDSLPSEMQQLFTFLLERCFDGEGPNFESSFAMNVFRFVLWSAQTLKIEEIGDALLRSNGKARQLPNTETLKRRVSDLCYPLARVQDDGTVALVHSTFKDFVATAKSSTWLDRRCQQLVSAMDLENSSKALAHLCVTYLSLDEFQEYEDLIDENPEAAVFATRFSFQRYAACNWLAHWQRVVASAEEMQSFQRKVLEVIQDDQGLTWLYFLIKYQSSLTDLTSLQANLNSVLDDTISRFWLVELLQRLHEEVREIRGISAYETCEIALELGWMQKEAGNLDIAQAMFEQVSEVWSKLGEDSNEAIGISNCLALVYVDQGKLDQAEALLEDIDQEKVKKLGEEHSSTIASKVNLAGIYSQQGKHEKAIKLGEWALDKWTSLWGDTDRRTWLARGNLIWNYQLGGKIDRAKALAEKHLQICAEQKVAEDQMLGAQDSLALIYSVTDREEAARDLRVDILSRRLALYGVNHATTLRARLNLGVSFANTGDYERACEFFQGTIQAATLQFGPDNSIAAFAKENYAFILQILSRYGEAQNLLEQLLDSRKRQFGEKDVRTLSTFRLLSSCYLVNGESARASETLCDAMKSISPTVDLNDRRLWQLMDSFVEIQRSGEFPKLACELTEQLWTEIEESNGEFHSHTMETYLVLCACWTSVGRWQRAFKGYQTALARRSSVLHPLNRLVAYRDLGLLYLWLDQPSEALDVLQSNLDSARGLLKGGDERLGYYIVPLAEALGLRDPTRAESLYRQFIKALDEQADKEDAGALHGLAKCLFLQNRFDDAFEHLHLALRIRTQRFGDNHVLSLESKHLQALIWCRQGYFIQAEALFRGILLALQNTVGLKHPHTIFCVHDLVLLLRQQGRVGEALPLEKAVYKLSSEVLGATHSKTTESWQTLEQLANAVPTASAQDVNVCGLSVNSVDVLDEQFGTAHERWYLESALQEIVSVLGDGEFWVNLSVKRKIASLEMKLGDFGKALVTLRQAWRNRYETVGPAHRRTLEILLDCVLCWKHLGRLNEELGQDTMQALSWAVIGNHRQLFDFLMEHDVDVDKFDHSEKSALYYAAQWDRRAMAKQLLDKGATANLESGGVPVLHLAASSDHHLIVRYLARTADIDYLTAAGAAGGWTALQAAVCAGAFKAVKELINSSANLDLAGNPKFAPPLHSAIAFDKLDIMDLLLEGGASLTLISDGLTPLGYAAKYNALSAVDMLLNKGAPLEPDMLMAEPAIHVAANRGYVKIVDRLLDHDIAWRDLRNSHGFTALSQAAYNGHEAVAVKLLERGADPGLPSKLNRAPLHDAASKGHTAIIKLLLSYGANLNAKQHDGYTPLHYAAGNGHVEAVKLLLEYGADPLAQAARPHGNTPLQEAALVEQLEVVKMLLDPGNPVQIDVNFQNEYGSTVILYTCFKGNLDMLELLLTAGADPSIKNNNGFGGLHLAAFRGWIEVLERLLPLVRSEINVQSDAGMTALHMAAYAGKALAVDLLLQYGANPNVHSDCNPSVLSMAVANGPEAITPKLLDSVEDPFRKDCYGRNSLDWALLTPAAFAKLDRWTGGFIPTPQEEQESILRSTAASLIAQLPQCRDHSDYRYSTLAHCFLYLRKPTEAIQTFQLTFFEQFPLAKIENEAPALAYDLDCRGCDPPTNITGPLFVCKQCQERSLCAECRDKQLDGSLVFPGCVGHDFWEFFKRMWCKEEATSGQETLRTLGGENFEDWMHRISKDVNSMSSMSSNEAVS